MSDDTRQSAGSAGVAQAAPAAAWTFFRQWLKNPRAIAALAPSSKQLARHMMAQLPAGSRRIVELGGGTGVFTRALIEHGIAPRDLLVLELNSELYRFLCQRFPDAQVVNGDACDLAQIVSGCGFAGAEGVDAVVSGLGFLSMPRELQRKILRAIFSVLDPGRPLIQFTYGPSSPIPRELLDELGLSVRRAGIAWINVPPARIYVFTRNRSTRVHAMRVGDAV
ncbi:MAG: methyltransferase domain-containing protein [Rhodanobacter sp.]|jgi:phospholipid N-methyltransferase|nr:methyltransferase domain-containing protein [Rhodanobacter sp.]